jgi:hypothetical protein
VGWEEGQALEKAQNKDQDWGRPRLGPVSWARREQDKWEVWQEVEVAGQVMRSESDEE